MGLSVSLWDMCPVNPACCRNYRGGGINVGQMVTWPVRQSAHYRNSVWALQMSLNMMMERIVIWYDFLFFFFLWFVPSALPAALTLWPSTIKLCPSDLIIWLHNRFSCAVVPTLWRQTNYIRVCMCGGFTVASANMAVSSCTLDVCNIFKQRRLLFWFGFGF